MADGQFNPGPNRWFLVCVALGLAANLLLLVMALRHSGDGLAGCGDSCEMVLQSRWSRVGGVPIAVLGSLVYLLLLGGMFRRAQAVLVSGLGLLGWGTAWFVFLQLSVLRQICPWCMAAHALGLLTIAFGVTALLPAALEPAVWRRGFLQGLVATVALAAIQIFEPAPLGYRLESANTSNNDRPKQTPTSHSGRLVEMAGGRKIFDVNALPLLGDPTAPHILVEYLDYQCPACRTLSRYLDALIARHPHEIAMLVMPVPLDRECNSHLEPSADTHPGSCAMARIALAVWKKKPDSFPAFHHALLTLPPAGEAGARELSKKFISPEELAAALADPWIRDLLQANIADWVSFSKDTPKLPKLLVGDRHILHGLPSGEADFIRVMERELGLSSKQGDREN